MKNNKATWNSMENIVNQDLFHVALVKRYGTLWHHMARERSRLMKDVLRTAVLKKLNKTRKEMDAKV